MFKLLEPANGLTHLDKPHVEILGERWVLVEYAHVSDAPEYTCISYAWGDETARNPLNDGQLMSTRTIGAIETAIKISQSIETWANKITFSRNGDLAKEAAGRAAALKAAQAFWIDALCVPVQVPARTTCLQSMGEIFNSAYQVMVVLTEQCSDAIAHTGLAGKLGSSDLSLLEQEGWVSRAWTYQEAVNSKRLYFVVEGEEDAIVSGHDFLNAIMVAIDEHKSVNDFDKITWEMHSPQLRSLERLLADYLMSDYETRSAYQVMSVMDQRISERADDHFYAMIGSITTSTEKIAGDEALRPSEYFMHVCERKGDFSFIYGTAPRSERPGQRWRPSEGRFPALLPDLITLGSSEKGQIYPTHLRLNNVYPLVAGEVASEGLKAARWFVDDRSDCSSSDVVAAQILKRLRVLGFGGCGEYLEFETGFFFPQTLRSFDTDMFAVVSHDIHWVTGGPGMLLRSNSTDVNDFLDVGVFVGRRPKVGEQVKVA